MRQINQKLDTQEGYEILPKIEDYEYNYLKDSIEKQWIRVIERYDSSMSQKIREEGIKIYNYHKLGENLRHNEMWPKKNRIFNKDVINNLLKTEFIKKLKASIGEFEISDEENIGYQNIYWRLVRPIPNIDIGGMHRDEWFWKINQHYKEPDYPYIRRKVWIPIYSELGKNGLLVKPYSQLDENLEWCAKKVDGNYKPRLVSNISEKDMKHLETEDGEMVIFHDKMLHGGSKNIGKKCRISIEFTALIRKGQR